MAVQSKGALSNEFLTFFDVKISRKYEKKNTFLDVKKGWQLILLLNIYW